MMHRNLLKTFIIDAPYEVREDFDRRTKRVD
jgi:hypothetical protein